MYTNLDEIMKAKEASTRAKKEFEDLVSCYIKENVDKDNLDSIEKAIFELPECSSKLPLYDMAYDLKNLKEG